MKDFKEGEKTFSISKEGILRIIKHIWLDRSNFSVKTSLTAKIE